MHIVKIQEYKGIKGGDIVAQNLVATKRGITAGKEANDVRFKKTELEAERTITKI